MGRLMQPAGAKRVAQWVDSLERATTFDSWGQLVEALDEYDQLSRSIRASLSSNECQFADEPVRFLNRLMIVINMRAQATQDLTSESALKLSDMKQLTSYLKELPNECPSDFPIHVKGLRQQFEDMPVIIPTARAVVDERPPPNLKKPKAASSPIPGEDDEEDEEVSKASGGSLLPRPRFPAGKTNVTMRVEKIQLKDPGQYFDPFITVTVVDEDGTPLSQSQSTPPTKKRDDFIHFNQDVELQQCFEDLPKGMAVFFEFKHYKPKKQRTSVKCFCFMELDEIKNGTFPLEIYQKPTDFKRKKKLVLVTERPYYLYVTVTLSEN